MSTCSSLIPAFVFVTRPYLDIDGIFATVRNPVTDKEEFVRVCFSNDYRKAYDFKTQCYPTVKYWVVRNRAGFEWKALRSQLKNICLAVSVKEESN
jgi:hypothetical protein